MSRGGGKEEKRNSEGDRRLHVLFHSTGASKTRQL